jgi:prepilin-type N-terminal cleavage/methylation domain-containing protein
MAGGQQKGFTLIELLVVIAIIGILSAVVLASLNTARTKGNDAAIKSDLDTVRTQSGVYFDAHSSKYNGTGVAVAGVNCGAASGQTANTMLADANIARALSAAYAINGSSAFYCNIDAAGANYAIVVPLATSGTYWCTDSTESAQGQNASGVAYNGLTSGTAPALSNSTDYVCN